MGVDFNRIDYGISSGSSSNGFGTIVSNPSGGDFPPNGTFYETQTGVTYPIAEGGEFFVHPVDSIDFPNQVCDVDVYHNGSGGFYNDWANATNVAYKPAGTIFWQDTNLNTANPQEVPEGSGVYYDSFWVYPNYTHDGTGGYAYNNEPINPWESNVEVSESLRVYYESEVPSGSETYFTNGKYDTYVWDGTGSFYLSTNLGSFHPNGTLITDVSQTVEVPSGGGGSYWNGKYTRYNWNGSGGVTTLIDQGSFWPNNTLIDTQNNMTEVPSGSGNFYPNGLTIIYNWNGSGGYTATGGGSHYTSGTFIYDIGDGNAYFWDGVGGYYTGYYMP